MNSAIHVLEIGVDIFKLYFSRLRKNQGCLIFDIFAEKWQIIKICQKRCKKVDQEKHSLLCQKTASIWKKTIYKRKIVIDRIQIWRAIGHCVYLTNCIAGYF